MRWREEKHDLVMPASHGRSVGLHISEVIRDYAIEAKVLDRKWITEVAIEDQNTNMMQVGLAWENFLAAYHHPEIEFHPGELYVDDEEFCQCGHDRHSHTCSVLGCGCSKFKAHRIYMSPDGISVIDSDIYPHLWRKSGHFCNEFKFTKKSSRDFLDLLQMRSPKTLMWQWQIMCYCKAMDTLAAKLHVMFINGNYSRVDTDPENLAAYKIFVCEYEQEDIDGNWDKFKQHARHMRLERMIVA